MTATRSPMARAIGAITVAIVSLGTLTACGGGGGGGVVPGTRADDSWTVMTYMIADTNLEYDQMDDMREQEAVGSRPGFNLISYVDRSPDYSDDDVLGIPNWSGAKVIEIRRAGTSRVLSEPGEVNTGDPAVLAEFITRTITAYPAAHYALIINDHGASWPGIGGDESAGGDALDLADLEAGIADGLAGAGIAKLDMLGLDACLMATYEVASVVQDLALRLVASEELEPGYGWNYTSLETAARGGTVDDLAQSIITAFGEQATQEDESLITLSETDLTKMPAVDTAFDAFANALTSGVDQLWPTVGQSLADSLPFGVQLLLGSNAQMTDLGVLATGIKEGAPGVVDQEVDALIAAIASVTLTRVNGNSTEGATGMAIYFPPQEDLLKPAYPNVATAGTWNAFLTSYYASSQAGSVDPAFAATAPEAQIDEDGLFIAQQVVSDLQQITRTTIAFGYPVNDGTITLIGEENARLTDLGIAMGRFDTLELVIKDGTQEATFYSQFSVNPDSKVWTIISPIMLFVPGATSGVQGQLRMTYDNNTNTILSRTFFGPNAAGTLAEVSPQSGSTFSPLLIELAPSGARTFFVSSTVQLKADPQVVTFAYRKLPKGSTVYAELIIQNSVGKYAISAGATGIIP